MRLPDFLDDPQLNALRRKRGADRLGDLTPAPRRRPLTPEELRTLATGGLDIQTLDELAVLSDGTLAYRGRRVLLYPRQIVVSTHRRGEPLPLPNYHVANCRTLQKMRAQQPAAGYAVAARTDGSLQVNVVSGGRTRSKAEQLRVCPHCLAKIAFRDYSQHLPQDRKAKIADSFTAARFFEHWPSDPAAGQFCDD